MISRIYRHFHRLRVRHVSHVNRAGQSRVEWEIGGDRLWFESKDARISAGPEAIACVCFAAAVLAGWKVRFPVPICRVLDGNLKRLAKVWQRWWGRGRKTFRVKPRSENLEMADPRDEAVFLSLGVDSFYTLLQHPGARRIVYVAGYDVKLSETHRLERIERGLREVGLARNMEVTMVSTNLREHPVFRSLSWERFHGAALAAVGHLLSDSVRMIVISSSYPKVFFRPWGSLWKTDHLWSSSILEMAHFGEDRWRFEKLELIADVPLVREHLRICWEHRNDQLNCGRCEKCLRTMLALLSIGRLDFYPTFPNEAALLENLRKTRRIHDHLIPTYRGFLKRGLPPDAEKAVRQLIRRSKPAAGNSKH